MTIFVMIPGLPQPWIQCWAISAALVCIFKKSNCLRKKGGNLSKMLKKHLSRQVIAFCRSHKISWWASKFSRYFEYSLCQLSRVLYFATKTWNNMTLQSLYFLSQSMTSSRMKFMWMSLLKLITSDQGFFVAINNTDYRHWM